jgi:hypothetical protein
MGQLGGAAQTLIGSIDQGLEVMRGGPPYIYFGTRAVRGWAVELVLVAALLPFLAVAVDLFARCRRRRIPLGPAVRSYLSRLAFWVFVGLAFAIVARVGGWPQGDPLPIPPQAAAAQTWPVKAIVALVIVSALAWIVARHRLIPRREVLLEEELAGYTAALLMLGLVSLLVVAVNAFALVFVLPSLHAWLWLPQFQSRPIWTRAALLLAGFAGPALLVWSLSERLGWERTRPRISSSSSRSGTCRCRSSCSSSPGSPSRASSLRSRHDATRRIRRRRSGRPAGRSAS